MSSYFPGAPRANAPAAPGPGDLSGLGDPQVYGHSDAAADMAHDALIERGELFETAEDQLDGNVDAVYPRIEGLLADLWETDTENMLGSEALTELMRRGKIAAAERNEQIAIAVEQKIERDREAAEDSRAEDRGWS